MITDSQLTLTVGSVTTAAVSSADVIDLSQRRDIGEGTPLHMLWTVTSAYSGGTGAYLQIYTCDNSDKSGNATQISQLTLTTAELSAGADGGGRRSGWRACRGRRSQR